MVCEPPAVLEACLIGAPLKFQKTKNTMNCAPHTAAENLRIIINYKIIFKK